MTSRRLLPLAVLAAALAVGGCGTSKSAKLTSAQEQARVAFINEHADYSDHELAHLCPGLYPRTFLTDKDKYPVPRGEKDRKPPKVTAHDLAEAKAAGCDIRP